jgi:hypothetical protein
MDARRRPANTQPMRLVTFGMKAMVLTAGVAFGLVLVAAYLLG